MSDPRLRKADASSARKSTAKSAQISAFDRLPLNALRVFEAVAANLSFAEAAEALHVTPAAVSMQIKSLEDYVQTPLFRRNGRTIELTPEGVQLLPGVRRGLADLQHSMQQLVIREHFAALIAFHVQADMLLRGHRTNQPTNPLEQVMHRNP